MSDFRLHKDIVQFSPAQKPSLDSLYHDVEATMNMAALPGLVGQLVIPRHTLVHQHEGSRNLVSGMIVDDTTISAGSTFSLQLYNILGGGFEAAVPFYLLNQDLVKLTYPTASGPKDFVRTFDSMLINSTVTQTLVSILRRYNMLDLSL